MGGKIFVVVNIDGIWDNVVSWEYVGCYFLVNGSWVIVELNYYIRKYCY